MDITTIIDRYRLYLSNKILLTEEDTANGFVNPFLNKLNYDLGDIFRVKSHYIIDDFVINYLIVKDRKPYLMIKVVTIESDLHDYIESLRKAFNKEEDTEFSILTNGIDYFFFDKRTDKDSMNSTPFLKYSLIKSTEKELEVIEKLFSFDKIDDLANNINDVLYKDKLVKFLNDVILGVKPEFADFINKSIGSKISQSVIEDTFYDILCRDDNKEDADTKKEDLSIIINLLSDKPKSMIINKKKYFCSFWKDVYTCFLDYIDTNYEVDFQSIFSTKLIFNNYSDLPEYLKDGRCHKKTKNGLYISIVVGKSEMLEKMNLILAYLGVPDCIEFKNI